VQSLNQHQRIIVPSTHKGHQGRFSIFISLLGKCIIPVIDLNLLPREEVLTPKDSWVFGCKTTQNYPF
jgi:hypothetical protein